jgi:hypothetical protein
MKALTSLLTGGPLQSLRDLVVEALGAEAIPEVFK